jgi:hypothetical protein
VHLRLLIPPPRGTVGVLLGLKLLVTLALMFSFFGNDPRK